MGFCTRIVKVHDKESGNRIYIRVDAIESFGTNKVGATYINPISGKQNRFFVRETEEELLYILSDEYEE